MSEEDKGVAVDTNTEVKETTDSSKNSEQEDTMALQEKLDS